MDKFAETRQFSEDPNFAVFVVSGDSSYQLKIMGVPVGFDTRQECEDWIGDQKGLETRCQMTKLEQIIELGKARIDLRVERVIAVHEQEMATGRPAEPHLRESWVPLKNYPYDYGNITPDSIAAVRHDVELMRRKNDGAG